jgi:hypothetical protein
MGFETIPELKPQGLKILEYMADKGYKIRALNIVYIEGIDTDLVTLNADRLDGWNDVRGVITDEGDVLMSAQGTTEPGKYYTYNRMNPQGVFRIAFGQYSEAWKLGKHYSQPALVQCGDLKGHRDHNEDGKRTGDLIYTGDDFYVNQHTTSNAPEVVGRWSAGCLVGRYPSTHAKFMQICRSMGLARFDTTVIAGDDFIQRLRKS